MDIRTEERSRVAHTDQEHMRNREVMCREFLQWLDQARKRASSTLQYGEAEKP